MAREVALHRPQEEVLALQRPRGDETSPAHTTVPAAQERIRGRAAVPQGLGDRIGPASPGKEIAWREERTEQLLQGLVQQLLFPRAQPTDLDHDPLLAERHPDRDLG